MTELETQIWNTVHNWCDAQTNEIPDQNRRYLMDEIKALVLSDGNCPDLTDQWNLITEKWKKGELTDLEQIALHRALDILERKGIVVMKHGI